MKVHSTNYKPFAVNNFIKVRVDHEDEFTCSLYLDNYWVMTVRTESLNTEEDKETNIDKNVFCMLQARKSAGVFTSPHFCPQEILDIIDEDDLDEVEFLYLLLRAFQNVYICNNSNYSFRQDAYEDMLRKFFVYPLQMSRVREGEGINLMHLFMPHIIDSE